MNLLFIGTSFDKPYLMALKKATKGLHKVSVHLAPVTTLTEVTLLCKEDNCTSVITTQASLLKKLVLDMPDKEITINNFAGSILRDSRASGIEFLIANPLKQTMTINYGQFLFDRYVSKFIRKDLWLEAPSFEWEMFDPARQEGQLALMAKSFLIGFDIETRKDLTMSCISFCGIYKDEDSDTYKSYTVELPLDSEYNFVWCQKYLSLDIPKTTQNGKYDINYLLRYALIPVKWYWDTANLAHSWYSELPKDLGFLAAFSLREARYWKSDTHLLSDGDLYLYNARDSYYTACITLALVNEMPDWAKRNYTTEFAMNYPCLVSELTGIKASEPKLLEIAELTREKEEVLHTRLQKLLSAPNFNPGSPAQVKKLLKVLGCADIKTTAEKDLLAAAYRHPLNKLILDMVLDIRKLRKLITTYLVPEKLFKGRVLYCLNPHGTETSRLASKAHHFWTGLQIQNIPRTGGVKDFMIADEGFLIGEADYAQAESRGTAYITGDLKLIAAVESDRDFHAINASDFFGIPYEEIVESNNGVHKVINKLIRNLAKRVNHGANYNMGEKVLVATMGLEFIYKAKNLLNLSGIMTPTGIAKVLLQSFANTYPKVRFDYQNWIKQTVDNTSKLVGATGLTRYCFGKPKTHKPTLNAYIAHCPQSLNAQLLNKAYKKVFYAVWIPHHEDFKLNAQIHDSILHQYRIGYEHLSDKVKDCMEFDTEVTDIDGITRTMRVPVDIDRGGKSWKDSKED